VIRRPSVEESVFAIVGLGNPGRRYSRTRHNLGFMVLDRLASEWNATFRKGRGPFEAAETHIGEESVVLAKPETFMNASGEAVAALLARHSIPLPNLLVICDDFHLPLGCIRLRKQGSHGGHKGLSSIIRHLHDDSFPRIRMGIGESPNGEAVEYVLTSFSREERKAVERMVETAAQAAAVFVEHGIDNAMNVFNGSDAAIPVLPSDRKDRKTEGR
jgi:PTH1 family peptidyl-tRNA hydrolase